MKDDLFYQIIANASTYFPIEILMGDMRVDDTAKKEFLLSTLFGHHWGEPQSISLIDNQSIPLPRYLSMQWLSLVEKCIYDIDLKLPDELIAQMWSDAIAGGYQSFVVGLAPYGQLALWLFGPKKRSLVLWTRGLRHNWADENEEKDLFECPLGEYCNAAIAKHPEVTDYINQNGMPPHDLFDQYMKQYTYRILPIFGRWDEVEEEWGDYGENEIAPRIAFIEAFHTDGTRDCTRTDFLMQYHEAGRPQKLALCWHIGKGEFNAYVWFDERRTFDLFEAFYATHPGVKASLLFHADPEANHYEWLLYSSDVIEPMLVAEDAYQMIVFRNRFEHYRTYNYNQPKGAWLW